MISSFFCRYPPAKSFLFSPLSACNLQISFSHSSSSAFDTNTLSKQMAAEDAAAPAAERQVMLVGVDDSEQSHYALQWTLRHFFSGPNPTPLFRLVIAHAKRPAASFVGLAGPASVDVLPIVEADLKKIAAKAIERSKELCLAQKVTNVVYEIVEGDPRNVLCEMAEQYHADVLVVGSHGYGVIKRAVLGSVSDYCAHHAHCTVMIVKMPKVKK